MTLNTSGDAGLHCPDEWADTIRAAMSEGIPKPREPGPDAVRVGLLIRQSRRRSDDSQGSPRGQLDAALGFVRSPHHHQWHVSAENVFADIGVSGWSSAVKRPAFDAMMKKVRAGELDVVVVFSLCRLSRKGAVDVLGILDEFARHGTRLVSVTEPWLDTDPTSPAGQAVLGLTAALARQESERKSAFITAAHGQGRQRGGHLSGRPPYGFMAERVTVDGVVVNKLVPDPETAPVVRDIVRWTLDEGLDLRETASRLTERETPTPTGRATWIVPTVRAILRDPRLAGFSVEALTRVEQDEEGVARRRSVASSHRIMYGDDGEPVSLHEGIVTPDEWRRLRSMSSGRTVAPRQRSRRDESAPVGHFTRLRLLQCGVCGRPLQTNPGRGSRYAFYTCNVGPGGPLDAGRHSMGITVAQVDRYIPLMAFRRLAALDPEDPVDQEVLGAVRNRLAGQNETDDIRRRRGDAERELGHVRAALRTLAEDWREGGYRGSVMRAVHRDSKQRLVTSEAQLVASIEELGPSGGAGLPADWFSARADPIGSGSPWSRWDMTRRRSFLSAVVDRAVIAPVGRKGNHVPVSARIRVEWVGSAGDCQGQRFTV